MRTLTNLDFPGILLRSKEEYTVKATREYLIPFTENFHVERNIEDDIYKRILDLGNEIVEKYQTAYPDAKIDIGYLTITVTEK